MRRLEDAVLESILDAPAGLRGDTGARLYVGGIGEAEDAVVKSIAEVVFGMLLVILSRRLGVRSTYRRTTSGHSRALQRRSCLADMLDSAETSDPRASWRNPHLCR